MSRIARRQFLKTASTVVAAAASTHAVRTDAAQAKSAVTSDPRIGDTAYTPVLDYPIQPKSGVEVTVTDTFWLPKLTRNADVTIPFEMRKLAETPADLGANIMEAAVLSLQARPDARLQAQVDARMQQILASPGRNRGRAAGAVPASNNGFELAATHYRATGRRDLLDRAIRAADALYDDFAANNPPFAGGERDAINCVQLYRVTHDKKHLDLAKHYLDIRGLDSSLNRSRHNQSDKPVLEQSEAVGHAVNCVSLMVSLVDVGVLTGIEDYLNAARRMWQDVVEGKLYITGGVGTTGNEGFGEAYSLPNISAYAETCAALMFMTLNHRLFMATGESRYVDVMERGMYNNAVDGVSVTGNRFFYVNRLASAGDGRDTRWERASLECCPPNLVRFMASMPGLIYAQDSREAIYINLYVSSRTSFNVGGRPILVAVDSEMPWGGRSKITVSAKDEVAGVLKLRIPGWARNRPVPSSLYAYTDAGDKPVTVSINGRSFDARPDRTGYVSIDREWKKGDVVVLELPMDVRRVIADSRVTHDRRRMAVERGPIVYCAEWPDVSPGSVEERRVLDLLFDARGTLTVAHEGFDGATVLRTEARRVTNRSLPAAPVTLIPYHLWANRGAGEMSVWLQTAEYALGDVGPAGGFIFYDNPNYRADGWRYLEAAPFDQSAGAPWGCFRRSIEGARGTAVGTGTQNTVDMLAACADPGTAAHLCANLAVNGVRGWFLPSRDELAAMYRRLKASGVRRQASATLSIAVSLTISPTGRRRSRPRTWRITSISPMPAGSITTTRIFREGFEPFGRSRRVTTADQPATDLTAPDARVLDCGCAAAIVKRV